jgi:hypothetical protein
LTLACVLAFLAGTVSLLASGGRGFAPPRELLEPAFEFGALPFGLEPDSAVRLPFGVQVVRLRRPGAEELASEPPAPEHEPKDAPKPDSTAPGAEEKPRIQWKKLPIAPAGEPPLEAALIGFGANDEQVRAWISEGGGRPISDLGDEGGLVTIDIGKFAWDAFDARYVHRRRFGFTSHALRADVEAGKAGETPLDPMQAALQYSDDVRIDLSSNGRAWGLAVIWPKGATGSKEQAFQLARALKPKPRADATPQPAPH